jgi:tryptophan-rich sensory protein
MQVSIIIPLVAVFGTSAFFPVSQKAGGRVSFRPPPYVFAIVWPILLILLGYSWSLRPDLSLQYAGLTLLVALWPVVFYYSPRLAFYEIILTALVTAYLIFQSQELSTYLLIPLGLWLSFASILNFYTI